MKIVYLRETNAPIYLYEFKDSVCNEDGYEHHSWDNGDWSDEFHQCSNKTSKSEQSMEDTGNHETS